MANNDELLIAAKAIRAAGKKTEAAEIYSQVAASHTGETMQIARAHSLRHAAELWAEVGETERARDAIGSVLAIYRHFDVGGLEMANTIRIAALAEGLSASAAPYWREAKVRYAELEIAAGVAEAGRRLEALPGD